MQRRGAACVEHTQHRSGPVSARPLASPIHYCTVHHTIPPSLLPLSPYISYNTCLHATHRGRTTAVRPPGAHAAPRHRYGPVMRSCSWPPILHPPNPLPCLPSSAPRNTCLHPTRSAVTQRHQNAPQLSPNATSLLMRSCRWPPSQIAVRPRCTSVHIKSPN